MSSEITYVVRPSSRAKRIRVTVDATRGVEVVVPASVGRRGGEAARARAAAAAVAELAPWIERRQAQLARVRALVDARGSSVPYLGGSLAVQGQPGRTRVHRSGSVLLVPDGEERLPAMERWYRRAARDEVRSRLDEACTSVGLMYSRLTIRGQRTRWASCSRSGAMSFNWRLLLAPEPVLQYVVWHEVCHLEVMDHSPRFWALLGSRWPSWREHSGWLRRYGATLVLE